MPFRGTPGWWKRGLRLQTANSAIHDYQDSKKEFNSFSDEERKWLRKNYLPLQSILTKNNKFES